MPANFKAYKTWVANAFSIFARYSPLAAAAFASTVVVAQVSVSIAGSPNYSHPIAVPPGTGGMQPNLALFYAGGGVSGPVGHGWSVQGLSRITRCPATRYVDGRERGVMFDVDDKLCLDGQRLIQTDANGAVLPVFPQANDARGIATGSREYRTEKDSYARIRAYGVANGSDVNGPSYFKVWTKAGLVYEYGASPSADANTKAAVAAQGKNVIMVWAVARVTDVVSNYINFKYEVRDVAWGSGAAAGSPAIGREWNVSEIQYAGNTAGNQVPPNKVLFKYSDRPANDKAEAYQQGSKNVGVRRLDAIETYVNAANNTSLGVTASAILVKRLALTYDIFGSQTNRSRLYSIRDCADAAEANCQPATLLRYSVGNSDALIAKPEFNLGNDILRNNNGHGIISADFNGDGRADLIRWANTPSENRLYLSNGDGSFTLAPNGTSAGQFNLTGVQLFQQASAGAGIDGCFSSTVVDINGDGLPDILRWAVPLGGFGVYGQACPAGQQTMVLLSKGDGSFTIAPIADVVGATFNLRKSYPSGYFCAGGVVSCARNGHAFFLGKVCISPQAKASRSACKTSHRLPDLSP
jgi:hypothetical protein